MVFKEKKSISKIQINIDILKNVTILGINFFLYQIPKLIQLLTLKITLL